MNLKDGVHLAERFIEKHLREAPQFRTRNELLRHSLAQAGDGLHLEFGVWRGESLNYLAALKPGSVFYGFDSFQGLPEDWSPLYPQGHMNEGGRLPAVRENVRLVAGLFQDTLPGFLEEHRGPTAFVHLDADLYSSTKYVLFMLADAGRLRRDTVVEFDELFYQDGPATVLDDESRVYAEFVEKYDVECRWLGYYRHAPWLRLRASLILERFNG